MYQSIISPRGDSPISVIGAGIAGAWQALLFARAGHAVTLHERSDQGMTQSTSYWAGGMLAPWCEAETSEPLISRLGIRSLELWREHFPDTPFNGSLVVAHPRDRADFERFARLTTGHRRLDASALSELEPSLEGRFRDGLFYADEGHVEPRRVLPELHARFAAAGGSIKFNSEADADDVDGVVIDCRGLSARDTQASLRGVKGEIILIETDEIKLSRPVRLIHPRWPLYVIPRGGNREARIVEFGSGLRPAFPDNLPRIAVHKQKIAVNGLYRHGFLLAPALAELTLGYVQRGVIDNEVMQCA